MRASFRPSAIISGDSVETTSALISPSTMSQIIRICSSIGRPSFAMSVGFVVTPSRIPQLTPVFNSSKFAVSRKNLIRSPIITSAAIQPSGLEFIERPPLNDVPDTATLCRMLHDNYRRATRRPDHQSGDGSDADDFGHQHESAVLANANANAQDG